MRMTLEDLRKIVSAMESNDVTEIYMDISVAEYCVESIDFDIWKDCYYKETILTLD